MNDLFDVAMEISQKEYKKLNFDIYHFNGIYTLKIPMMLHSNLTRRKIMMETSLNSFDAVNSIEVDGRIFFRASQVAEMLGYQNPRKAIRDHCKQHGILIRSVSTKTGRKEAKFISEGNLYRLIVESRLPQARQFESWIFDEMLPQLRRKGFYQIPDKFKDSGSDSSVNIDIDLILQAVESLSKKESLPPAINCHSMLNKDWRFKLP